MGLPGSSPRVRGKRCPIAWRSLLGGLIPARAGKTRGRRHCGETWSAHPRACGENLLDENWDLIQRGSSPRVRGKLATGAYTAAQWRLIPARAGKTQGLRGLSEHRTAHPRACGENWAPTSIVVSPTGSSPRVRGKPAERDLLAVQRRLIPARAGKTHRRDLVQDGGGAHPRACGENTTPPPTQPTLHGSSPRVRGKLERNNFESAIGGLIPARAGKTTRGLSSRSGSWAHPRACGENDGHGGPGGVARGSSPRVRGKRDL